MNPWHSNSRYNFIRTAQGHLKNEIDIYTIKTKSLLIVRQSILFNPAKIENLIIHHSNSKMHPHIRIVTM